MRSPPTSSRKYTRRSGSRIVGKSRVTPSIGLVTRYWCAIGMTGTVRPTMRPTSCAQIPAALTTTSHGTVPSSVSPPATRQPPTLTPRTFAPVRTATPRLAGAVGERPGERRGIDPAVGRQVGGALHSGNAHQREQVARFLRRDQTQRQPEGARPADLALELEETFFRRRQAQASHLAPAGIAPGVVPESSIELDARHVDSRQRDGRAELAHEPGRVEGGAAGQLTAIEDEDVVAARDRQVIRDAAAGDAADDDDADR